MASRRFIVPPLWIVVSGCGALVLTGCGANAPATDAPTHASSSVTEDFSGPLAIQPGAHVGRHDWLTFELYRQGTFAIDHRSGALRQSSESYRDSAIIRSTNSLPRQYKVRAVVGDIRYELDAINGLMPDPEYHEGPANENGCYLLAITDTVPDGHHTNDWWHQHRKLVIDVDNNVWGSGMPHPIFMVYFDTDNHLVAWDGAMWQRAWTKAVEYQPDAWYTVEVERTATSFILSVYDEAGTLMQRGTIETRKVWHADEAPDYFVVGDPHENYYQGSMKIQSITLTSTP